MDNFMDKLAQRFNAQEIIKANAQAEAQEMSRLQTQIEAYDECLQEMRKLNLKNVEMADRIQDLIQEAMEKRAEVSGGGAEAAAEQIAGLKESLEAGRLELESLGSRLEEFVHKENVKVYRNVQAVVIEELKTQKEGLEKSLAEEKRHGRAVVPLLAVSILLSLANLAILATELLGLF